MHSRRSKSNSRSCQGSLQTLLVNVSVQGAEGEEPTYNLGHRKCSVDVKHLLKIPRAKYEQETRRQSLVKRYSRGDYHYTTKPQSVRSPALEQYILSLQFARASKSIFDGAHQASKICERGIPFDDVHVGYL